MANYEIIDEPRASSLEKLIVNPIVILLAGIFVPIFWYPPLWGKFWLPVVWLLLNGYFLGSSSWKKEWLFAFAGIFVMFAWFGALVLWQTFQSMNDTPVPKETLQLVMPYFWIAMNTTLFFTLYTLVFTQSTSYELYQYMQEQRS